MASGLFISMKLTIIGGFDGGMSEGMSKILTFPSKRVLWSSMAKLVRMARERRGVELVLPEI